jgi:glyoxylase-like metal-dependent hydrolase (beta-lactamase superfamily II)
VLFAGDLLEEPVPVTLWGDLVTFTETLKSLRDLNFSTVISAHSGVVSPELCERNIEYIKDLLLRKEVAFPAGADEGAHPFNVKYLQYLKYEELARAKEGKSFDLSKFKREFWTLAGYGQDRMAEESKIIKETPPERYEEAWERYLRR